MQHTTTKTTTLKFIVGWQDSGRRYPDRRSAKKKKKIPPPPSPTNTIFTLPPGTKPDLDRLLALFNLLFFALLNPLLSPIRTLNRKMWELFLAKVPLAIQKRNRILNWIYPGPSLDFIADVPSIKPEDQECFSGYKAIAVLKEFLDHYFMGKFLGPFPAWVKSINGNPIRLITTFIIQKQDTTLVRPKNRVLINCSEKLPAWRSFQPSPTDPDFQFWRKSKVVRTFNDALIKFSCNFTSAREIIKGLFSCKLIWKADMWKGFRTVVRNLASFSDTGMLIKVIHPITMEV